MRSEPFAEFFRSHWPGNGISLGRVTSDSIQGFQSRHVLHTLGDYRHTELVSQFHSSSDDGEISFPPLDIRDKYPVNF